MTRNRPNATLIDKSRLAAALADFYHIEVDSVIELGTVCGVVSRDGRKYIWKCLRSDARDGFRVAVQRYVTKALCRRGLPAPEPLVNRYGRLVTTIEDQGGYLQPWLSGHPVNPLNRAERLRAAAALGWFHAVSADLSIPAHGQLVRGSLLTKLVLKRNFLLQVWDQVAIRCPLLARDEATLFAAANRAIAAAEEPAPFIYAHRDAAPHNLLAQRGGRVALIDFDEAGLDDPLLDLFQFANHGVALGALAPGYFRELVEVYSKNCPLSEQRRQCLWVLFSYPDVLVRTVSEWARRGWADDGLRQVRQAVELERLRREILKQDAHRLR
jgi:Ser/Thr protein kinase RdoA (MazF antagonist)